MSLDLPTEIPLSHMLRMPKEDLQTYQLRKLSEAKNLRKRVMQLLDDWIAAESLAQLAEIVATERSVMAQLAIPFPREESLDGPEYKRLNRNAVFNARKRGSGAVGFSARKSNAACA